MGLFWFYWWYEVGQGQLKRILAILWEYCPLLLQCLFYNASLKVKLMSKVRKAPHIQERKRERSRRPRLKWNNYAIWRKTVLENVGEVIAKTMIYFDISGQYWNCIYPDNVIEWLNWEILRYICVVGHFPDGSYAFRPVCVRELNVTSNNQHKYMKHLEDSFVEGWLHSFQSLMQILDNYRVIASDKQRFMNL